MPVSTFSSDTSAIRRNSGHGALIARWNNTRERILEDDRRMSISEVVEMDGTGLHERDNWPLTDSPMDRSVSPETVVDGDADKKSPASPRVDEVDESAVMRRSEDIGAEPAAYFDDDEDDQVSELGEEDYSEGESFEDGGDKLDQRRIMQRSEQRGNGRETLSESSDNSTDPSTEPGATNTPAVSPIRGQMQHLQAPSQEDQAEVSLVRDEVGLGRVSEEDELYTNGTYPPPRGSSPDVRGDGIRHGLNGHREHDGNGERNMSTPVPFSPTRTVDSTPSASSSAPTSPRVTGNQTPTPTSHGRQSSIMKGTPPQRSASRRSMNSYTTTQIPHNKDRVRYSWQSLADDEPNRPRIHIIKLVSNTATASAGFPQGEAFGFSTSPGGRRIAAYNSARLYVLQTTALPVGISQDYALKRRPLAVEITDEGHMLALLADEHTVNIYDLGHQKLKRMKTISLDFPATCIALAPTGGLLAVGYEGGIEVFSLYVNALATDRRAVRSQRMDRMSFSEDGSTLLGTTTRINVSSTVVVSVPVFPASANGIPTHEELKEAWCTELLHPDNIRNSSHAIFMREQRKTCNERLFAWNGLADTFGILNIGDMQYGNIDFPVVISPPLSTCGGLGAAIHSCPAIDEHGDTVAMVVNDRTIRLYIVPHKAEDDENTVEAHSIDHELDEGYGCPFSEVRWVYSSQSLPAPLNNQTHVQGRLIVTSPGGVAEPNLNEEMVDDIEGGRIIMFDFDPQFAGQPGQTFSLTLGKSPPQLLEEAEVDVAQEVALVRRRTVNQSKSGGLSQRPITLGRAATTFGTRPERPGSAMGSASPSLGINVARRSMMSLNSLQSEATRSLPDLLETNEALDTLEEPYAQNAPRSQASLQRAASNAQRHRFQTLEERNQERVSVDSSGGFLPLPEYTEEPNAPLPSRFRAMAGLDAPAQPPPKPAIITNANGDRQSPATSDPPSAPAALGEGFSAEQAMHAALARAPAESNVRRETEASAPPIRSVSRTGTFDSLGPMPRSLQRAYGNAMSSVGNGAPPGLIGDWENVSPIIGPTQNRLHSQPSAVSALNATRLSSADTVPEEEAWDIISPVATQSNGPSSPFTRATQASNPFRYSTSLLNPPGHISPMRAPSSASSYGALSSSSSTPSSRTRRMPAHIQAFRAAAAANHSASASLFPPTHPSDHVPLREPPSKAGSVAHPITAWHPPAPSVASAPPPGSARAHSRKSSLSNKSAFASTAKAKRLGFFSRGKGKKSLAFGPEFERPMTGHGAESMMETKSMFTTLTGSGNKCSVM